MVNSRRKNKNVKNIEKVKLSAGWYREQSSYYGDVRAGQIVFNVNEDPNLAFWVKQWERGNNVRNNLQLTHTNAFIVQFHFR